MDIHMLKLSSASDGDQHMDMLMHFDSSSNFSNNPLTLTDHFSAAASPQPLFYSPNSNAAYPTAPTFMNGNMASMREMIFRIAVMQPVHIDPESVKPPKRRNVKISKDPQSVAARHRRERISEKIRILQRLVPGGTKMDTASMLDEAIHYVKFLKKQVQSLEQLGNNNNAIGCQPSTVSSHMLAGAMHHHVLRST